MPAEDYDDPTAANWGMAEQLVVGVAVFTPGVAWHQGVVGFETVVVAYLALLTFLVAMVGGEIVD